MKALWWTVIACIVGAAILFVVGIGLVLRPPTPPFTYTQAEYQAERPVYAPGETLSYTASLTIDRAGAIEIIRGFRARPSSGRARLCNGQNATTFGKNPGDEPPPFPPEAIGTEVEGRVNISIPELPPGDYWLISSASKKDGGESLTKVAFSITQKCP